MKFVKFLVQSITLLLIPLLAFSVPKYTNKENAFNIAKSLDKGHFRGIQISSTYVLNDTEKDFYISAILSNGTSQKWYINQLYQWSRTGDLELSNNRILIFPDPNSSKFEIFEKNKFYQLALQGKVFIKTFPQGDPLADQKLKFNIKTFNLISPQNRSGKDPSGAKYWFVLDLTNKSREFLTYEDAYWIMKEGNILQTADSSSIKKVNSVKSISPFYGKTQNGQKSFGVKIQFRNSIQYEDIKYPYEIYENTKSKGQGKPFYMDITLPNNELKAKVKSIKSLEYLHNIKIVQDRRYPQRVLLSSKFDPLVLDIPPNIAKTGDKTITVTFFKVMDQTVAKRTHPIKKKKTIRKVKKKNKIIVGLTVPKTAVTEFDKKIVAATSKANSINQAKTEDEQWNILKESIKLFEEASMKAENDSQLLKALSKRNLLRRKAVNFAVTYTRNTLNSKDASTKKATMLQRLESAENYTATKTEIDNVEKLINRVNRLK